jgi:hypothetical protein
VTYCSAGKELMSVSPDLDFFADAELGFAVSPRFLFLECVIRLNGFFFTKTKNALFQNQTH